MQCCVCDMRLRVTGGLAFLLRAQDASGDVWTGHRDGHVRVWSEASCRPVCQPKRVFHSDVRRAHCRLLSS